MNIMVDEIQNKYVLLNTRTTIVVLGQFHPGIFTPDWFSFHEIVSKEDCDNAKIKFIESSVIHIDFGWFIWFSDPHRIMIELNIDGYDDQMLDLLRSILTMFSYTKVSALGINFHYSLNINSIDDWHSIGHTLTPKDIWKNSFGHDKLHYGMREAAIQIDDFHGEDANLNIAVKTPNNIDQKYPQRVMFEFNNHFNIPDVNDWSESCDIILNKYFGIKKHNSDGYKKMLASIFGGVK